MITNTAPDDSTGQPPSHTRAPTRGRCALLLFALVFQVVAHSPAATVLGPWVPMFKGIDHAVGTNTPGAGGFPDLQVVNFLRVDLTDTDIRLFASPRHTNWVADSTETYGYTTTNFVKNYDLQVAINANEFSPASYFQAEGIACNVNGMVFSQGNLVSPPVTFGTDDAATFCFTSNNVPTYYPTNIPAASTNGVYTAVSGYYNILYNGVNVGSNYIGNGETIHQLQPRTAFGLSHDRRYLFLLVVDGRQDTQTVDYSAGAYDWETAEWLKLAGAWDGANMDGGGSTCMVMRDTTGVPIPLNHDSASLTAPGYRERTVGAHLGIYAAPLPGFFNDIKALPDDTAATITWTTTNAATTQLKYGTTTNMSSLTASNAALLTNHAALLTNLTPNTGYYFAAMGSIGPTTYVSPNYFFLTTNYVAVAALFDFANSWKYMTANLDGINWTARTYNDSGWDGSGPGLLWVSAGGPNPNIPVTLNTEIPADVNDYPFATYYFRTHFIFTNDPAGATLQLEAYVDDGAVFYLNGTEIQRVRMAAAPTVINNSSFATANPCSGDATCPDTIVLSGPLITTNLLSGDNVVAVEVHNRSATSHDVTFGLNFLLTVPFTFRPTLSVAGSNGAVAVQWSAGGFVLQEANAPTGGWTDVSGPVFVSPFLTNASSGTGFFRLRK